MLFKSSVSLLLFCMDVLFIIKSRVLKYPFIIVLLTIFNFMSVNAGVIYLCSLRLDACKIVIYFL